MPNVILVRTGQQVAVSDFEAPSLLARGIATLPRGIVNIKTKDGKLFGAYSNDPNVVTELAAGGRIESPEEAHSRAVQAQYGGTLEQVKTFAEGAARTASFGLSDMLETAETPFGQLTTPEAVRYRQEANPLASAAGGVAAIAGSMLIPGGAVGDLAGFLTAPLRLEGAVSAAAGAAAEEGMASLLGGQAGLQTLGKALAKSAGLGAQGVVDGALFGAGQLVSEHALGEPGLNAERMATQLGVTTLISGATGAALGGLIGLAAPAATKAREYLVKQWDKLPVSREALSEYAKELSKDAAMASVSPSARLMRKLGQQGLLDATPEALLSVAAADGKPILQAGLKPGEILERLKEAQQISGNQIGQAIIDLDAQGIRGRSLKEIAETIRDDVLMPLTKYPQLGNASGQVDGYIQAMEALENASEPAKLTWLQQARREFSDSWNTTGAEGEITKTKINAFRKIERILNGEIEEPAKAAMGAEAFAEWKAAKDAYHSIATVTKETGQRMGVLEANRFYSLSDRLHGGAALAGGVAGFMSGDDDRGLGGRLTAGAIGGAVGSLGAATAARLFRTRGASTIAVLMNKASAMMAVEKLTTEAANLEAKTVSRVASALASDAAPRLEDIVLGKMAALSKAEVVTQGQMLRGLVSNPAKMADVAAQISEHLGDVAPEISQNFTQRLMHVIGFLASKAPMPPPPDALTPNAEPDWEPTQQQTDDYSRYANALNNPAAVYAGLATGSINVQGIEAVRTVFPETHREYVGQIIAALGKSKTPVPYNKRVLFATVLQAPALEPTLGYSFMHAMQSVQHVEQQQEQAQKRAHGGMTLNTSKSIGKIAKNTQSGGQRLADLGEQR